MGALRGLEDALGIGRWVLICVESEYLIHCTYDVGVLRGWRYRCWRLLDSGHGTHRTTEVDWEGRCIEGPEIRDLVRCVNDHTSLLNEWQPEDGVDGDVGSACDTEMGWMPLTCQVREVELEAHGEFGRHRFTSLLDNTTEGDGQIISFTVDSRDGVGICLRNCCEKMEVPCRKCRSSVNDTADSGAIAAAQHRSQLESDVWKSRLDLHWEGAAGGRLEDWDRDADHENRWVAKRRGGAGSARGDGRSRARLRAGRQ